MMLTGNTDKATSVHALERADVFHYLTKPCETATLMDAIKMCLDLSSVEANIAKLKTA